MTDVGHVAELESECRRLREALGRVKGLIATGRIQRATFYPQEAMLVTISEINEALAVPTMLPKETI